jgi:hypothetical protein
MKLPPPPYQGLLKTSSEFVAELTPEKLDDFIEPVYPEHNGDDFTPEVVQRLADARDQAAEHLMAIRQRLDALTYTLADDWCAPRGLENELHRLSDSLGLGIDDFDDSRAVYFVAKYLTETLRTLQEADADLVMWQRMTPAERDQRWDAREREKAEAAERRQKRAEISKQQNAFYTAFFAMGISPIPMGAAAIAESALKLNDIERQISNMGNHLYE